MMSGLIEGPAFGLDLVQMTISKKNWTVPGHVKLCLGVGDEREILLAGGAQNLCHTVQYAVK